MYQYRAEEKHQPLFRSLLEAMSNPGQFQFIDIAGPGAVPYALLLDTAQCLLDHEVSYTAVGSDFGELSTEISRRTGSAYTDIANADYIFVAGNHSGGAVLEAKRGTSHYPDLGATIIFQVEAPVNGETNITADIDASNGILFAGPGIKTPFSPPQPRLALEEYLSLKKINAEYPLGVDTFILYGNDRLLAIPRSTRITVR